MKLVIQIPCLNEAETLPRTVADLPRRLPGFDAVELLVIDDGSTDDTAGVARRLGVDHVVRMNGRRGLARAFTAGVVAAIDLGADVVVNTDADNQYRGADVAALVAPILAGRADIVLGTRPFDRIEHFSPVKRLLQVVGARVVKHLSGAEVADATTGFRAMTRDAALRLNVFGDFTYTIETVIQAGLGQLRIASVPIRVNAPTRPSRLFRSNLGYVSRGVRTMLSVYTVYRPTRLFSLLAAAFLVPGLFLGVRYLALMAAGEGKGHVQSVVACGVLVVCGVFMGMMGAIAHLLGINRRLLEEVRYLLRSRLPGDPRDPGLDPRPGAADCAAAFRGSPAQVEVPSVVGRG